MIMLLSWLLIGLLLGGVLVAGLPVLFAWVAGDEAREQIGQIYAKRMMEFLGSAALVAREQGGLALASTSSAPKLDADELTVDGEKGHLKDDTNSKGFFFGKEFGLGIDSRSSYISPLLAELGSAAARADQERRLGVQPDGGVRLDFEVPRPASVPDLTDAKKVLTGSTSFRDAVVAEDWARKSQEKFHEQIGLKATLAMIGGFCAGAGMALLLLKYGGDAGGTTVPVQVVGGAFL